MKKRELFVIAFFLFPLFLVAQDRIMIKGKVTEAETGEALPGVSIMVEQSTRGVTTDVDGTFEIGVLSSDKLIFSFIGMQSQTIEVKGQRVINVAMQPLADELEEVVVVAFGTQKRTDLIGAVTTIKPSTLRAPTSNLTTSMAGQIPGIIAYQRSGEPGMDDADFFIRGVTSFGTGKVNPLILIDGMELTVTELSRLRPDDIESFSVMKDATSTALYGARGANGVIFVTTKQGREGAVSISFRAEGSVSEPTRNVEFADPVTYMKLYNDALTSRDPFADPYYTQEKIESTQEGRHPIIFPAIDWRKSLFKDRTFNHRYNLSVSGGGKIARYYVAGSFAQDNGNLKVDGKNNFNNNIDLKSFTLRANVNINLTRTTELIVRLNGNFDNYTGPIEGGSSIYYKVARSNPVDFPPYYPADEAHKHVKHILFGGLSDRSFINPYADMVKGYKNYDRSLMLAQMELKQDLSFITEGLRFRTMFNTNRVSRYDIVRSYKPFYYELPYYDRRTLEYSIINFNEDSGEEFLSFNIDENLREQNSVFYMETAIDYSRVFNDKHSVSAMLVNILSSRTDAIAGSLQLSLPSRNLGLSGRATYGYDSRYFAEFNFGYNGSERFHESHRFGFFPSFGLAWSVSNEKFWAPIKQTLSNFRLRATYGLVGNDAIGSKDDRFFYLSNVVMDASAKGFTFGREYDFTRPGINVTRFSNPHITWEQSKKTNLAIELGLFDKVNIQAGLFTEKRENILMTRSAIPSTMGLSAAVRANVGEASGKGTDISIEYSESFTKDLWLQVRGNFTYAASKYVAYEEPLYEKEWWKSRIGYSINQPWGYIAERLFVDDNEVANSPPQNFGSDNIAGDIKYKDVNGDGVITSLDQVPIGFPTVPEIVYGGGFSFGYKNFDLSAFFQGSARSSFWMGGYVSGSTGPINIEPFVGGKQILKVFADSHFSADNQDLYALWPRLSTQNQRNNTQLSTWWINNGAFLRLKQVEMGYTFPKMISSALHINSLRLYVSGTNLFLISGFKLWDVEMGGNGLGYPLQRVINIGVNVSI